VQAVHPARLPQWHEAVLELYRRQVVAARHQQQQMLLGMGDPAAAVMISDKVPPKEFVNDGYIWLALTHHLLGAGRLEEVRARPLLWSLADCQPGRGARARSATECVGALAPHCALLPP
jgi:hypothetical protein